MKKTKTAAELEPGEVILESARQVEGGKISIGFAARLVGGTINVLALLNKSDDRFSGNSGVRRAWMVGEKADIEEMFGIELDENLSTDKMNPTMINLLKPTVLGQPVNIQIHERTESQVEAMIAASDSDSRKANLQWYLDNADTAAKRAGKDGNFLTKNGEKIYSFQEVVAQEPEHVFIKHDPAGVGETIQAPAEASAVGTPEN